MPVGPVSYATCGLDTAGWAYCEGGISCTGCSTVSIVAGTSSRAGEQQLLHQTMKEKRSPEHQCKRILKAGSIRKYLRKF